MSTIEVGPIHTKDPGFMNGVEIFHHFYNAGEKEIKYITFHYLAYNSVGDVVMCTVKKEAEARGRLTGPIRSKYVGHVRWENMWYNPTISTARITKIYIQYMDNTEEEIDGKDIVSTKDQKSAYYHDITIPEKEEARAHAEKEKIDHLAYKLFGRDGRKDTEVDDDCSALFLELKDDRDILLKTIDEGIDLLKHYTTTLERENIKYGFIIGDYIEREHLVDDELMQKAVLLWKESIANHHFCIGPGSPALEKLQYQIEHMIFVKKYSEKIRKYEPEYVAPKK